MGHTYRGAKSGCKLVTEFDSYSYDGVSAGIRVIHTEVPNLNICLFLRVLSPPRPYQALIFKNMKLNSDVIKS